MLEGLYAYVSDSQNAYDDILWLDLSFKDVCDILQSHLLIFNTPVLKDMNIPKIDTKNDPKEVTVCLSGGKDSAACAYYYKQLGYKVHLYHATGINKAYGDEKTAAKKIAEYLGCDLFIDKFLVKGTHTFIEHPLKNYVIANGAVHYCLANGFTPHIAFGNFNKSVLDMNEFEVCAGDCIELWDAYRPIIQSAIPNFDIFIPLETNVDTFNILAEDWKLFELAVSCMSPFRFRAHWKHRCEEQYNIRLFENRCGVCWKCAMEAMWLMDTGKMDYNQQYYLHCFGILVGTICKESGRMASYDEVWENYMFYPLEDSKAYSLLPKVVVKYGKNNCVQVLLEGERVDAPVHADNTIGADKFIES